MAPQLNGPDLSGIQRGKDCGMSKRLMAWRIAALFQDRLA